MFLLSKRSTKNLLFSLLGAMSSLPGLAQDAAWTWSKQCEAKYQINVTVRLDGKVEYQGLLPICRGSRDAEDGAVEFHFLSRHLFGGQYRARKADNIEGDIWQASSDTDALILGVSFATKHQILLNTLHVAKVHAKSTAELDKGLYITTYPVVAR
jgi:hypothetical protein